MSGTDFLTSAARFFVKIYFHKKYGVFEACKKVADFFDTQRIVKLSATGREFKVPQFLSRMEIKNLTRPGVNKRQVSF